MRKVQRQEPTRIGRQRQVLLLLLAGTGKRAGGELVIIVSRGSARKGVRTERQRRGKLRRGTFADPRARWVAAPAPAPAAAALAAEVGLREEEKLE